MYWNVRAAARQHLATLSGDSDSRLLDAMVIGERDPSLAALNDAMARAGIAHFLSISGLHLGVFLGFVFLLCRVCMLRPRTSAVFVLAVLAAYLLLAEPRAPLLRSAIMAASLCAAVISSRRYSSLNALAVAAVVLLAIDPRQLMSAGFQLSFAIVVGIVLLRRPVRRLIFGRWIARRGLTVFRQDRSLDRWLNYTAGNWLMEAVVLAVAAYVSAAPLMAAHFGIFTPYAAVLSLLLFPLVAMVLVPGYVSMALLWPLPGLAYTVGQAASWAAGAMARAVGAIGSLPCLAVELRPVSAGWVAMCYAVVLVVVFARRLPFGRGAAVGCVVVLAGWTGLAQRNGPAPATAELHLLAVGGGQCGLLRAPSGRTYIIDAGTTADYDAYKQVFRPALLAMRLPAPSAAFISHANTDHFNAAGGALADGSVRTLYLNDYFAAADRAVSFEESAPAAFMRLALASKAQVVRLRAGQTVQLDGRTRIDVLWPPADRPAALSVNDTSLVLRISCDDVSVLVTGDLDDFGQASLAAGEAPIAADALVLPHHGGWEPSLPAFVEAVAPKVLLVSARTDPSAGHAAPASDKARFYGSLRSSRRYYSTCGDGHLTVRFGAGRLSVTGAWADGSAGP
jgi:competence protein ComEC